MADKNLGTPRLFNVGRGLLIAALMAAPLAYGSVQTWAWASLTLLAVLILFVWGIACVQQGAVRIFWSPLYLPAGLFLFWAVAQYAGHLTVDYIGTREAVVKLATDCILFFLAGQFWAMGSEKKWDGLGIAVTIYAFVIAFLAIVQFFSGPIYNYWNFWSVNSLWGAFGPYVNRNHYAGLMEMLIPLSATYVLSRPEGHPQRNLLGFSVLLPIASLLLSGSRGGFVSLLVEIIILGTVLFKVSLISGRRSLLSLGILGVTAAAILFFWIDPGQISKRLEGMFELKNANDASSGHRGETALDTLLILRDHPLTGTGVGSFATAFPQYQTVAGDPVWDHAHNDYAEALAETGVIGGVLILGALAIFLKRISRYLGAGPKNVAGWMQLGAAIGVLGILIHSFFDFNLRIPANAAWFAVCCGLAFAGIQSSGQARSRRASRAN
ncbi:MAG TPA: O-antigen ligase family protein [Terriglobia bacterium]|nr:O-antigen ligase family protein [Terriglobia bacterium]